MSAEEYFHCPLTSRDLEVRARRSSQFYFLGFEKRCSEKARMGSEDAIERTSSIVDESNPTPTDGSIAYNASENEPKRMPHSSAAGNTNAMDDTSESDEGERPPLPPRPHILELLSSNQTQLPSTLQVPKPSLATHPRPIATTALSLTDIQTQSFTNGSRETYAAQSSVSSPSHRSSGFDTPSGQRKSHNGSEGGDSASIRSFAPNAIPGGDIELDLGDVLPTDQSTLSWIGLDEEEDRWKLDSEDLVASFNQEFEELAEINSEGSNEEALLDQWRSKRKHFHILSAAGKPIYNRHGSDNLISGQIGAMQTIISFYESAGDELRGFTAGKARFVVMTRGPLYLVAISKLDESDAQLRVQLEALYMQILSTLTLPTLAHLFSNRPSTDLRRPLQGTEALLSALADSFTRGSPPALLSALECLKLKKSHRQAINNVLLKTKCKDLLYGLIVAGGRLVSVVRPRTHSLHPGDLQLIFNMLFEAGGVKAGGGENWIPMCLPGFNKNGYLYMYVSFVETADSLDRSDQPQSRSTTDERVAVLLISATKESFYELRAMRDDVLDDLEKTGKMELIKAAVVNGRPAVTDIVPGTVLKHFLYKSRGNLQYVMPTYEPHFKNLIERRRLLSLYSRLQATVQAKMSHLKVYHCVGVDFVSLAWITPMFELYCVASSTASRNALAQGANKVIQWVRREEERIFIIGGAVF